MSRGNGGCMDKTKAVPIIMSLICVVLAVYAVSAASELNAERSTVTMLNAQVVDMGAQLAGTVAKDDEQIRVARDMQNSLDNTRGELNNVRGELNNIRAELEALRAAAPAAAAITAPAE